MFILRPRANRQAILLMLHILKPHLAHPSLNLTPRARIPPKLDRRINQSRNPLLDLMLRLHASILTIIRNIEILELGPAARLGSIIRLTNKTGPIRDRSSKVAEVDKVEFMGERPRFLGVVDFEFNVGGDPGGLGGGEVGADDVGGGEVVAHFDGPDARTCADVQYSFGLEADGREV